MKDDANILFNLKCYLESLLASGQDKICYNDLLYDEKTIDCINAIEDLLKERKKYTIRLTDEEYKKVIENAQRDIAEQKDKRIQELERKNKHLSNTSDYETISLECTYLEEQLDIANSRIQDLEEEKNKTQIISPYYVKENYIPKQAVIDKIEENKGYLEYADIMYEYTQKDVIEECIKTLQELLEGERK